MMLIWCLVLVFYITRGYVFLRGGQWEMTGFSVKWIDEREREREREDKRSENKPWEKKIGKNKKRAFFQAYV